ncbi:hypothetical protein MC885_000271 [Smutsia gigantea]|nr:hypothetical protein MC885_000271 [Smutsia gigantea]
MATLAWRPSHHPAPGNTCLAFACIYSTLILHKNEVMDMENNINTSLEQPVEMLHLSGQACLQRPCQCQWWEPRLQGRGWWTCARSWHCTSRESTRNPHPTATPAEEWKVEAKKEASEESDHGMGFGLFD